MTNRKSLNAVTITAWNVLMLTFAAKIFGGGLFEQLFSDGGRLVWFDNFFERSYWLQVIVASITSYISHNLFYLAICKKKLFKWRIHIFLMPYFIVISILNVWLVSSGIGAWCFLIDIISIFIISFILLGKPSKKYFRVVMGYIILLGFQLISLLIKSATIAPVIADSALIELVFTIDLFAMLFLWYCYSLYNKKNTNEEIKDGQICNDIFQQGQDQSIFEGFDCDGQSFDESGYQG